MKLRPNDRSFDRHGGIGAVSQNERYPRLARVLTSLCLLCFTPLALAQPDECKTQATADSMAPTTMLLHDTRFEDHDTGVGHPERPQRVRAIVQGLRESASWDMLLRQHPQPATDAELNLVHSNDYIASLKAADANAPIKLDPDTVLGKGSLAVARLATGAALDAVDAIMSGQVDNAFVASRPPGHHAFADAASGFCIFNHVAVAARYAQTKHGIERVLIVDWDVHHGNATERSFYADSSVMYFSTHQYPHYPQTGLASDTGSGEGLGTNFNVPLPAGSGGVEVLAAFRDVLLPAAASFKPQLVLISAGFDSHADDPLADFRLTAADFEQMTRMVREIAHKYAQGRLVSVLEGGYNLENLTSAVKAHVAVLTENWNCDN